MEKPSLSLNFLHLLCLPFFLSLQSTQAQLLSVAQTVPALYVFGDSIVDSGNNLNTVVNASYLPYGYDFPSPASGRFTNGKTVADMLGLLLNLSLSIPLWASEVDKSGTTIEGFNYASATAGILPDTGCELGENTWGMQEQIALFNKTVENYLPRQIKNPEELSKYLSRSIFVISVGSNDYLYNYLQPRYCTARRKYDMYTFGDLLMSELEKQLKDLYELGARKIVLFELGPIGCFPMVRKKGEQNARCDEDLNTMLTVFNGKLYYKLTDIASSLVGTTFIIAQTFKLIYDMVENPFEYGLNDATATCCAVEEKGERLCVPGKLPCDERHSYLFWDQFHLTEAANKIVASKCLNESSICTPLESVEPEGQAASGQPPIFTAFSTLVLAIMISISYFVANFSIFCYHPLII